MDGNGLKYLISGIREELDRTEANTDFVLDDTELISELRCFYALIIVENNRRR
jgi:hypothetical protein